MKVRLVSDDKLKTPDGQIIKIKAGTRIEVIKLWTNPEGIQMCRLQWGRIQFIRLQNKIK